MNVDQIMSRRVYTCSSADSLNTAARLMWEHDCGAVPVVSETGELVGIITDRDICMAAYTQGKGLQAIPVAAAMAHQVYSCKASDTIEAAEQMMRRHQIRRLPVVDGGKRLVGFVSLNDLALDANTRREGEHGFVQTMGEICKHRHAA